MQGLLTQIPAKSAAPKAGKVDNSPLSALPGIKSEVGSAGAAEFSSLFGNMLVGNEESAKGANAKSEKSPEKNSEISIDALLSAKGQEQNKKSEISSLKPEAALSPEVLQKINDLLGNPAPDVEQTTQLKSDSKLQGQQVIGDVVASTSSNLDQLLNALKGGQDLGEEGAENVDSLQLENGLEKKQNMKGLKSESPLEFLLKESKKPSVGMETLPVNKSTATEKNSLPLQSKLGLSGEEFMQNAQAVQIGQSEKVINGDVFNPQQLMQKNMGQTMKAYGQKQNLLNTNVIKNTKDLALKDSRPKSSIDELKTPDLKIGADLSTIKENFIPVLQRHESGQNLQAEAQPKVLDLSRLNTSNSTEIIKRISDYIEQSQVANRDSLDLTVKHDSLGQFNIQVNKAHGSAHQALDMQITTNTTEGHEFFMKNEIGLMKNLSQAGIQLSDLRIVSGGSESMSFSGSDQRQSNNSQFSGENAPKEFMSFESGDSSNGSQRRRALWEQAQQNQQRYGA